MAARSGNRSAGDEKGPLGWLYQRRDKSGARLISQEEYEAGLRLQRDFLGAMLNPKITASWSATASSRRERRGPSGFGQDIADHVIGAKQRFDGALRAVGPEHADLLVDICCFEKGLGDVEKAAGWPQRSGKLVLQIALRQLARHYGLIQEDLEQVERNSRIRHWGASGYRPDV